MAVSQWQSLDEVYSVGEFQAQLWSWDQARRFVVVRERLREDKASAGRRLLEVPGYTFRIFVTNDAEPAEVIWHDYNQRSYVEKRIAELKYDLAADDFCMREFFATEAAFRGILMLFNLLSEFQRASQMKVYRQPATLRAQVFLCGAILGRVGHRTVQLGQVAQEDLPSGPAGVSPMWKQDAHPRLSGRGGSDPQDPPVFQSLGTPRTLPSTQAIAPQARGLPGYSGP